FLSLHSYWLVALQLMCIFGVVFLVLVVGSVPVCVYASSPSFVRQEIRDGTNDSWDHTKNEFISGNKFADLSAVSYYSDGQFLNATLFMRDPFVVKPSVAIPGYGMLIDADSDYHTGWQGFDYMMRVTWNNSS